MSAGLHVAVVTFHLDGDAVEAKLGVEKLRGLLKDQLRVCGLVWIVAGHQTHAVSTLEQKQETATGLQYSRAMRLYLNCFL